MQAHAIHPAPFAHPGRNLDAFPIKPRSAVADFGAGSGHYALEIAKRLQGDGVVYAVDVQQDLLRRIKNEAHRMGLTNLQTIWGDVARHGGTRLAPHSVDTVLMSNVLFQLDNPKKAFDEARRILKVEGTLIVIDWSGSFRGMGPTKRHVIGLDRALEYGEASGFQLASRFAAGAHHYGFVFHKASV